MRHRARFVLAMIGAAVLCTAWLVAACADGVSPVLGVSIQGGDRTLEVDDTVLLTADVEVTGTAVTTVNWSSDDPATATVDADGLVTAVGIGEANVTARSTVDPTRHDSVAILVAPSGTHVWTRQFGTAAYDLAWAVAVDAAANVLVAGLTEGALAPDMHAGGFDAFVIKFDAGGDQLWTYQFGTAEDDAAWGVAVDADGNAVVVGHTFGALPGQTHLGNRDAFVVKLDPDGAPIWTRQFGTTSIDYAAGVAVDAAGNVFVVGDTWGTLPGQTHFGHADAFVVKLDRDGVLVWAHQFGTSGTDYGLSVAVDAEGYVLVAGMAGGALPGQTHLGGTDAFVRKLDPNGVPIWTHQFGTSEGDDARGVAVDARGDVVVSGFTAGVLDGASAAGGLDGFAIKLDPDGERLWTHQYGTTEDEYGYGVALDARGFVLLVGETQGALGGPTAGDADAFVRRLKP